MLNNCIKIDSRDRKCDSMLSQNGEITVVEMKPIARYKLQRITYPE